jgi:hypothetical protein
MNPTDAISAGRTILDPVMVSAGFQFVAGPNGGSSGGNFARASYVKEDRRLEFSYRFALGAVEYYVGDASIGHDEYMQFLGKGRESAYAWFSRDSPMAGFEALKKDLEIYFQDFLVGSGGSVRNAAENGVRKTVSGTVS